MPLRPSSTKDPISRYAEQLDWYKSSTEIASQEAIQKPFRAAGPVGEKLWSFLQGDWLHEPLHVVLTDVPIGSWTVTVVTDAIGTLTDSDSLNKVADVSLVIGLVGATSAAVTGLVAWSEIKREAPRRIGSVHAMLNVAATALFAASLIGRTQRRRRTVPRALALAGYLLVSVSAHLGGNLIYEHGIGVSGHEG